MVTRAGVRRLQAFDVLNHVLLLLIGLACFYPLMHVLSLSLSSERAIVQGITWFPRDIDLISYKFMLTHHRISAATPTRSCTPAPAPSSAWC